MCTRVCMACSYFLMFIGVQPLIMTWIAVTAFIIFAMCWFAGCILWSFRAVSVLKASLAHATRRDQLKRFDTMLRRSVVFSRCAMALSLLLVRRHCPRVCNSVQFRCHALQSVVVVLHGCGTVCDDFAGRW